MRKRRRSREVALQVLYQFDVTQQDAPATGDSPQDPLLPRGEKDDFSERIVLGVLEHRKEIDELLKQFSEHWRLNRMSVIDRTILRMATFELLYCEEIPPKVTLNEAIDLGKRYGSEESGSFINGILDQILKEAVRKPLEPTSSRA